jgi:hypothetical protein
VKLRRRVNNRFKALMVVIWLTNRRMPHLHWESNRGFQGLG